MHEHAASLNVSQEGNAETDAVVCAFQQARDVGDHKAFAFIKDAPVDVTHTEVRHYCGERVICDFRFGIAASCEESAFPGIGNTDEAYVSHQLQLYVKPPASAHLALLTESRSVHASCSEVLISSAALATLGVLQGHGHCTGGVLKVRCGGLTLATNRRWP